MLEEFLAGEASIEITKSNYTLADQFGEMIKYLHFPSGRKFNTAYAKDTFELKNTRMFYIYSNPYDNLIYRSSFPQCKKVYNLEEVFEEDKIALISEEDIFSVLKE